MGTTRKQRKPLSTTPALDAEPPPPPEPERKIVKVERGKKKATTDEVIERVVLALLHAKNGLTYSALLADPAVADMKVNEGRLAPIFASRSSTSGASSDFFTSAAMRLTIAVGVPAGANRMTHAAASNPG